MSAHSTADNHIMKRQLDGRRLHVYAAQRGQSCVKFTDA